MSDRLHEYQADLEPGDLSELHREWYGEGWAAGRLDAMRELREETAERSWAGSLVAFVVGLVLGAIVVGAAWLMS